MDKLELRSEKVRKIIGPIPRALFVVGLIATIIISISLIAALLFIPSPASENDNLAIFILNSLIF